MPKVASDVSLNLAIAKERENILDIVLVAAKGDDSMFDEGCKVSFNRLWVIVRIIRGIEGFLFLDRQRTTFTQKSLEAGFKPGCSFGVGFCHVSIVAALIAKVRQVLDAATMGAWSWTDRFDRIISMQADVIIITGVK